MAWHKFKKVPYNVKTEKQNERREQTVLGYIKQKKSPDELYESDFLNRLKSKKNILKQITYWICFLFFEIISCIKYVGNIITVKQLYNAYIFILPFNMSNEKKIKKCMKKVQKLIKKYHITSIVFSKEIEKQLPSLNENVPKKVHLLDGNGLMPYLIKEILEYIVQKQGEKIELLDLYFCMNEPKQIYIDNIKYLAHFFRNIHIVTPRINNFQKIVETIEEKEGTVITISNNKKKSMKRAKLIINFDFKEVEMKKYSIYRRAVIITMKSENNYENVGFEGIQIQKIEIDTSPEIKEFFSKYHLLESVPLNILYESLLNKQQKFYQIRKQLSKDQVRVIRLYGKNGIISEKEYENLKEKEYKIT